MPARAPPREFHMLRVRVPRHRRWIDVHGAPDGAPGREPSHYAPRAGVRPCRRSCLSTSRIDAVRPSKPRLERYLRVTTFFSAIKGLRHGEERPGETGARLAPRTAPMQRNSCPT